MRNAINKSQRIEFVKYWADYVRTHPDKEWSKQQAVLVDSMIDGAREFSKSCGKTQKKLTLSRRA